MSFEQEMIRQFDADYAAAKRDFEAAAAFLEASELHVNGRCVRSLAFPKVFDAETAARFARFAAQCFSIFNKVIDRYLSDPAYRALFPFERALEELILLEPGYRLRVPVARIDIFFGEESGTIKLCEVNTDGSSAMNEDRVLQQALQYNGAFQRAAQGKALQSFELFDSWVTAFCANWRDYAGDRGKPCVAIVDFLDRATLAEFHRFAEAFARAGISAEICDIRALRFDGERLLSPGGTCIDAIYRRAVTTDIMQNYSEVQPFLEAVRRGKVCLIGSLRTQIIHNKYLFHLLHGEETQSFLSGEDRAFIQAHVPKTYRLNAETIREHRVLSEKALWIIKPYDLYGSKGVYAGFDCTQEEWEAALAQALHADYLLQEFCLPHQSINCDFSKEDPGLRGFSNITGLFCYNETLQGIYSRLSKGGIISSQYNEKGVATLVETGRS
ncbi:MAG: hypothetical protein LBQ33_04630 [Oscillospiraceae bacterium]|jgi:hypothetical protein|nr:hypothetical protein [Oscillospiraceae bacterium]